jgi:hypothetical protein
MAAGLEGFQRTHIYEVQAPAVQLLADLKVIREFDKQAESQRRWSMIATLVLLAMLVGSFFVRDPAKPVFGPGSSMLFQGWLLIGGIGLVTMITLWIRAARRDVSNRRYELFGELTELLRRDMRNESPITVRLDLAPPNHRRKQTGNGKAGPWKVTYFQDPWLRLRGRFADGTTFQISVLEKFQARTKTKRSSSGKMKSKSKTKSSTLASVKLFPKSKRYANLGQVVPNAKKMVRLPPWGQLKNVQAKPDELALVAVTSADWTVRRLDPATQHDAVELVGKMLLSLYQVIHFSKRKTA